MANSILLPKVALARSVMLIHSGVVVGVAFCATAAAAAAAAPTGDAGVLVVVAVALVISSLCFFCCQTVTGARYMLPCAAQSKPERVDKQSQISQAVETELYVCAKHDGLWNLQISV